MADKIAPPDVSLLTDGMKTDILNQRLLQFASEAYQHHLNRLVAEATNNTEGVTRSDEALQVIGVAVAVHKSELADIPVAVAATE